MVVAQSVGKVYNYAEITAAILSFIQQHSRSEQQMTWYLTT